MLNLISGLLAIALYLAAASIVLLDFRRGRNVERRKILPAATLAALAHAVSLAATALSEGGLNFSFFTSLSVVAWVVIVLSLAGSLLRPMEILGVVLYPLGALAISLQMTFGRGRELFVTYGWQMDVHIALALFGYAILTIAATQAILLAVQERTLRSHRLGGILSALPPLEAMEHLLFQLIWLGFALLTLTLITGLFFVDNLMAQHLVHKTVLSTVGWFVFGTLLWGRWRYGWRGRMAIRMTLAGMLVLLLAYFGSKLVLELILHRV
ncbi:MAG: cytochrome c biogenesis protein CcsA [Xanthomonadales bacterium]|nr:cytochrome c biogenesis protein CcsA [Xanthomonadales bacterium]